MWSLRIILIGTLSSNIMLIIHMLGILLRMALRLLAINVIQALGLDELVDFGTSNANEEFFGELVGDCLAYSYKVPLTGVPVCREGYGKEKRVEKRRGWV
jgi:hypothetical protein